MTQHATQRMIKPNGLPQQAIVSISPWVWSRPGRLLSFGALPINGTEADEAEAVVDFTRGPCVLAHEPTSQKNHSLSARIRALIRQEHETHLHEDICK